MALTASVSGSVSGAPAVNPRASDGGNEVAKVRKTSVTEAREARDSHDATIDRRNAAAHGAEPARADRRREDDTGAERRAESDHDASPPAPTTTPPRVARFEPEVFADAAHDTDSSQLAVANQAYAASLGVVEDAPSIDAEPPAEEPDYTQRLEAQRAYESAQRVAAAAERAVSAVFDRDIDIRPESEVF